MVFHAISQITQWEEFLEKISKNIKYSSSVTVTIASLPIILEAPTNATI